MASRPDAASRDLVEMRSEETLRTERRPLVPASQLPALDVEAAWLGMKLILNESQAIFNCREALTEKCDDKDTYVLKKIFKLTQRYHETRHWLGTSSDLWADYAACFEEAVVQIQDLYQLPRGTESSEEAFTTLVINNASRTLKDFERINDLILVARNMLVNCPDAQRYAIETTCHHEVFNIIQICIEFTCEGFVGETGSTHEETFGQIINAAKTALVTCLQFLFNLLQAGKELRTRIWLELLCLDTEFSISSPTAEGETAGKPRRFKRDNEVPDREFDQAAERLLGPFASATSGRLLRELLTDFRNNSFLQLHLDKLYKIGLIDSALRVKAESVLEKLSIKTARVRIEAAKKALIAPLEVVFTDGNDERLAIQDDDEDFVKFRKCFYPTEQDFTHQKGLPASPYNLSELPIILAPNGEVEALPMTILTCIGATKSISDLEEKERLEQAIRCFFLVQSTTGRMLLRELYIFIAAWDLSEHETFFKGMVCITTSFHEHNLLYEVYNALADPKDIISPGQNILIKVVHHILKSYNDAPARYESKSAKLKSLDANLIRFLLSIFRTNIVPRTLAIVWLQGQVRDGFGTAEDFERANLNLWDMERAYEGVYQFLEFFSVLNENHLLKNLCIQYEIAWDVLELIRYLHEHIPVQRFILPPSKHFSSRTSSDSNYRHRQRSTSSVGDRMASLERPDSPAISNHSAPSQTGRRGTSSVPAQAESPPPSTPMTPQPPHTYPWRNLKKMSILVLSGLLYNTPSLRTKIREYNGVLLIASCSEHDENNPYIKEHAVLCLKFLLEGDRENQRLVKDHTRVFKKHPEYYQAGLEAPIDDNTKPPESPVEDLQPEEFKNPLEDQIESEATIDNNDSKDSDSTIKGPQAKDLENTPEDQTELEATIDNDDDKHLDSPAGDLQVKDLKTTPEHQAEPEAAIDNDKHPILPPAPETQENDLPSTTALPDRSRLPAES